MSLRSLIYWLICTITAAIAASAAEPDLALTLPLGSYKEVAASAQPVLELHGRALILFTGIMAMAFTYRRAWLNWKREA